MPNNPGLQSLIESNKPWMLYGQKQHVGSFVREILKDLDLLGPYEAIGVCVGNVLVCGVVYHTYTDRDIVASIASISPRWATKSTVKAIFEYPFQQLKCERITAGVNSNNAQAIRFLQALGFKKEGRMRRYYHDGDQIIYGMLRKECKWIK